MLTMPYFGCHAVMQVAEMQDLPADTHARVQSQLPASSFRAGNFAQHASFRLNAIAVIRFSSSSCTLPAAQLLFICETLQAQSD